MANWILNRSDAKLFMYKRTFEKYALRNVKIEFVYTNINFNKFIFSSLESKCSAHFIGNFFGRRVLIRFP